jgi:hypothetical protein
MKQIGRHLHGDARKHFAVYAFADGRGIKRRASCVSEADLVALTAKAEALPALRRGKGQKYAADALKGSPI